MKYFVLKPHSKHAKDPWGNASRVAMRAFARSIEKFDPDTATDLFAWAEREEELARNLGGKP